MLLRALTLALLVPVPIAAASQAPSELDALRPLRVLDLEGREHALGEFLDARPLVLAYTGVGCPIAQKYAPRLSRLAREHAEVRFLAVDACPQDAREAIAKERDELGLELAVLKDFRQALTRALDAKTTTEVFLFDARGALRYRGAVDDQYSLGASKPEPSNAWLADALDALAAGKGPAVAATEAPGCKLTLLDESELPEAITWSRDVSRIVQKNCEPCHRPGQVGPFSLQSYEKARGWGEMIADVVEQGRMPPWKADAAFDGRFANERRLTSSEKERILRWVADGMPRGNPEEDPEPVVWPEGWSIGEPDAIFSMERFQYRNHQLPEKGFAVPREGVVDYQYFVAQTSFPEDRWVQAIEVKPGAADVVHHVLVLMDDPRASAAERERLSDFKSYFAVAVPGDTSAVYPPGYGKRLPAGVQLVFQMHYTPNGKERFDRSSVAMIFCDEPPELEVVTEAIVNDQFRIPPGAESHEVRGEKVFQGESAIVALFPHMHTRGHDFRYIAHYPDGSSEDLLVSHYDFNWQEAYLYPDPVPMPDGTRLECIGHFDNSANNPNNPDPSSWVAWGEQTYEEMFIGYYDTVRPIE